MSQGAWIFVPILLAGLLTIDIVVGWARERWRREQRQREAAERRAIREGWKNLR